MQQRVLVADELVALIGDPAQAQAGVAAFSYTLAHVVGADEARLVSGLQKTDVVQRVVELARAANKPEALIGREERDVLRHVLGGLVNLACIGGVPLVKEQDGFDFMLEALRSDMHAVQYYAVAGLQNMCGNDTDCAWRVVQSGSEPLLQTMLTLAARSEDEAMKRFATGALSNIEHVKRTTREPPKPKPRGRKARQQAAAEEQQKKARAAAISRELP